MFNGHKWWHKVARTGSYNDLKDIPTIHTLSGTNYTFRKIGNVVQLTLHGCTSMPSIPDGYKPLEEGWQTIGSNNSDTSNVYTLYFKTSGELILLLKGDYHAGSYTLYGTFYWMTE